MTKFPKRKAFTLIEMLVVIAIIVIIMALLIPVLARVRETARSMECQNNLRQFGIGFNLHADRDPSKALCTGAYDYKRDGCPDTYGWVADLLKIGAATPGKMLCPTNDLRGLEKLNDLIGAVGSSLPQEGAPASRLAAGACLAFAENGGAIADPAVPGDADAVKRALIVKSMVDSGINTNYTQSWFMARQELKLTFDAANNVVARGSQKGFVGGMYGLSARVVEASPIQSSAIPLLGDASPGDINEAALSDSIPGFLDAGVRLGESFNDGPSAYDPSTNNIITLSGSVSPSTRDVNAAIKGDVLPLPSPADVNGDGVPDLTTNALFGGSDGLLWLQDYRDWYAVHGSGRSRSCNILMADGSVKSIADINRDGYLNPGFPVVIPAGGDPAKVGYTDGVCEMGPFDVYGGPFINSNQAKGKFEPNAAGS